MQYPIYATYPFNFYPYYNYLSAGVNYGQTYGYNGYRPWTVEQEKTSMQHGNPGTGNSVVAMNPNGYYQNYRMGSNYFYSQYPTYFTWRPYPMSNWFNPQQSFNQLSPWGLMYNYGKWPPMPMNYNGGTCYSWPMMNCYSNQMMFPNYLCPTPTYWGVQRTVDIPQVNSTKTKKESSESKTLKVTSSEVIRDYNLPPAVAKRTRSDIPRPSVDVSDMKELDKSKDDMEIPFLFRVSDSSIKQIASSRSFGPSMVYNTESDNKPLSSQWQLP